MKTLPAAMFAALLASPIVGCASQTPTDAPATSKSAAAISLYESPCYFPTCVSYTIEVVESGAYTLTMHPSGQPDLLTLGKVGPDVWAKAQAAFAEANFAAMAPELTVSQLNRPGGVPCINDLPDATFTQRGADGVSKSVKYSTGCNVPAARKLLSDLRALLPYKELGKTP